MANEVWAGLSIHLKLDHFTEEERRIIHALGREFYVTNGGTTVKIGNSNYRYCLIKFPESYKLLFRAEGELIVLFSSYDAFEPRTLTALDTIISRGESLRLDKISAFVVSKDQNFPVKLAEIEKTNKEMWTIVPFVYGEFRGDTTSSFFKEKVSKHFFSRDLFDFDAPLREERWFFGRGHIVDELVEKHLSIENGGIFGLRRSGKTSILFAVKRLAEARGSKATIVDGQALNVRSWPNALLHIVKALIEDHAVKVVIDESRYSAQSAADAFETDIKKIVKKLNRKVLLIIDEVEHITFDVSADAEWRQGEAYLKFWHVVRGLFNKHNNIFTILIAGTNPRCVEKPYVANTDNPLYGQITPAYIKPFDTQLTIQMVQALGGHMGLHFDDEICAYLTRDYGGHPFLIRQACSALYKILSTSGVVTSTSIDRLLYEENRKDFDSGKGQRYCEMIVGVLAQFYPDEYEMLRMLAIGDLTDFENLARSDSTYTEHLLGYGVVEKTISSFDFKMDVLKRYLQSKHRYQNLNLSTEEKWNEIMLRRNRAEQKLRILVKQQYIFLMGKDAAKAKMLSKFDGLKKSRYSLLEYDELFDPNKFEIYFSDLVEMMRTKWEDGFRNLFEESVDQFNSRMTLLNSIGRGDAHAKNISDADFMSFRGAMTWLEEKLSGLA